MRVRPVGGSTNMSALLAMAKGSGIDVFFDSWDKLSRSRPRWSSWLPRPWGVTEMNDAGGVPGVMMARQPITATR